MRGGITAKGKRNRLKVDRESPYPIVSPETRNRSTELKSGEVLGEMCHSGIGWARRQTQRREGY